MKKILSFLLVAIFALACFSCGYVSGDDTNQQVDRKKYTVSISYKSSAISTERTENAEFVLEKGKTETVSIPKIDDDGTDYAFLGWVVNGTEAQDSVGISSITVKRTETGATVTVGSTSIQLEANETAIVLTTKYPQVDAYELAFSVKTSLDGTATTENKTVYLVNGSMDSIALPQVQVESGEIFVGWTVNGTLAENSANATTVTISRIESGIQLVLGSSTFSFDADQTTIEFATEYQEPVVPPTPVYNTYELAFIYKTSLNGTLSTSSEEVDLTAGDEETVTLPVINVEENQTFNGWTVNGELAQNSASATTLTISRSADGIQVVLGNSVFDFANGVVRIEFTTQYGQPITPPPVSYLSYEVVIEYQTSESAAQQTKTYSFNLEKDEQKTYDLPAIEGSGFEYWIVDGMAIAGSDSSTTFTITRTNDGKIVISIGSSNKEYSETVAKITIKTKFDDWTKNY